MYEHRTFEQMKTELEQKSPLMQAFCTRSSFVLVTSILLMPFLLKKEMREMKVLSYMLFAALVIIIKITAYHLFIDSSKMYEILDQSDLMTPKPGIGMISALSIISVAFIFQF